MAAVKGDDPAKFGPTRPIAPNRSRYPGAPVVSSGDADFTAQEIPKPSVGPRPTTTPPVREAAPPEWVR